jgi:hypothetical protein
MSDRKKLKETITEAVLAQLPSSGYTVNQVLNDWWMTKSSEGLRLSAMGDMAFRHAEIEFFDLPLKVTQNNWHKFILDCSKKIKCPYYIGVNKEKKETYIRLYDSKIAVVMTLYGDIHSYLESIKVRK